MGKLGGGGKSQEDDGGRSSILEVEENTDDMWYLYIWIVERLNARPN